MGKFFKNLKEGLEEAIAFQKGKKKLRLRIIETAKTPRKHSAKTLKKLG